MAFARRGSPQDLVGNSPSSSQLFSTKIPADQIALAVGAAIQEAKPSFWEIYQPQIGKLLDELPELISWYPETSARQSIRIVAVMILFLFGVVVVAAYLAATRVMRGDAIIFLVGSIVGYVFAFLQRYLGVFARE
jgi:hypothetical protein